jgi:spore coat polysaccharide biosynthesis protein SpsF
LSSEIVVFIQARMSSRRFPGKVLAPFRGRPIIRHVIDRVAEALPEIPRVVVTSTDPSDDPLVAYVASLGGAPGDPEGTASSASLFRGPLDDVLSRFRLAAERYPARWLLRICADSPLLDGRVLRAVANAPRDGLDLVTTTAPRTWPKGHNAELINAASLAALRDEDLDAEDREHVTRVFHRNREKFRVSNVESGDPSLAQQELAVDTIEDLQRLESM